MVSSGYMRGLVTLSYIVSMDHSILNFDLVLQEYSSHLVQKESLFSSTQLSGPTGDLQIFFFLVLRCSGMSVGACQKTRRCGCHREGTICCQLCGSVVSIGYGLLGICSIRCLVCFVLFSYKQALLLCFKLCCLLFRNLYLCLLLSGLSRFFHSKPCKDLKKMKSISIYNSGLLLKAALRLHCQNAAGMFFVLSLLHFGKVQ